MTSFENEPEETLESSSAELVNCFYGPTGALILEKDPLTSTSFKLEEIRLATPINSLIPLNTLTSFTYDDTKYRGYKWKNANYAYGYFNAEHMEQLREEGFRVTSAYAGGVESFTEQYSWAIAPVSFDCRVSAYKYSGCNGGRSLCSWNATADNIEVEGIFQEVVIPGDADCGSPSNTPERVCCAMGENYIRGHLEDAESQKDRSALVRIGEIICEIGDWHFQEYNQDPWGEVPDALAMFYDLSISKIGTDNCVDCTYESLVPLFEEYRDRLFADAWSPVTITTWRNMAVLLRDFKNADFAVLPAAQKCHAIKILAQHLDNGVWDEEYQGEGERNERLILRLLKYKSTDHCTLLGMMTGDEELMKDLLRGFNDLSFLEGRKDEYFEFVKILMEQLKACPVVFNPQQFTYTKALHIGFVIENPGQLGEQRCEIEIAGDCFSEVTFRNPHLDVQQGPNGLIYSCGYSSAGEEMIRLNGPLDYVPVFVESNLYGGFLEQNDSVRIIPAFLLCYLRDQSANEGNRTSLQALIAAAVITINISTLGASSGIVAAITAIDIVGTVVTTAVNQEIASGNLRSSFPAGPEGDADYQEFIDSYQLGESIFNTAMITQGLVELIGPAFRRLIRSVKKGDLPDVATSPTSQRVGNLVNGYRPSLFNDFPNIKTFLNQQNATDLARLSEEVALLPESTIAKLNQDLLQGTSAWKTALVSQVGAIKAYRFLGDVPTNWRLDPDILERLRIDLINDDGLETFLLSRGDNGVRSWKYSDDIYPTRPWCVN